LFKKAQKRQIILNHKGTKAQRENEALGKVVQEGLKRV